MSKSEQAIQNETLVAVTAEPDTIAWRHNTGQAWQGRRLNVRIGSTVQVTPRMVILEDARPIKFGLPGSSDIIGCTGSLPLAVEIKAEKGRQDPLQVNFQRRWELCGGLYIIARSPEQAVDKIRAAKIT